MSKNDQVDRLMRLRQQQLKARDPHAKQRKVQRKVTARRRKLRKQGSFLDIVTDVPYKWQGLVLGALIGMIISLLLSMFIEASWVEIAGLIIVVFLAALGLSLGQAFDARDELRDLTN